jgi:hypothetical protein
LRRSGARLPVGNWDERICSLTKELVVTTAAAAAILTA